jgi:hypothetical protein
VTAAAERDPWRSWDAANPCPRCGGWRGFSGEAPTVCTGGLRLGRPELVYCSTDRTGAPTAGGRTTRFRCTPPYRWSGDAEQRQGGKARAGDSSGPTDWPHDVDPERFERVAVYAYRHLPRGYRESWGLPPVLFEVHRFELRGWSPTAEQPKRPKEIRPAVRAEGGCYWSRCGRRRVPYRLPELRAGIARGARVVLCEGEKACEAGYVADGAARPRPPHFEPVYAAPPVIYTTAPAGVPGLLALLRDDGGAEHFAGLDVLNVVLDRDANQAGEGLREHVTEYLVRPRVVRAARFWRAHPSVAVPGADLADHVAAGFTLADLEPA